MSFPNRNIQSSDEYYKELIRLNCGGEGFVLVKRIFRLLQSSRIPMGMRWDRSRNGSILQYLVGKSETFQVVQKPAGMSEVSLKKSRSSVPESRKFPPRSSHSNMMMNRSQEELKKSRSTRIGQMVRMWENYGKKPLTQLPKRWKSRNRPLSPKPKKIDPIPFKEPSVPKTTRKECPICFDDVSIDKYHTFFNCSHSFCIDCCVDDIKSKIMKKQIPLPCPDAGCSKEINQYDLN